MRVLEVQDGERKVSAHSTRHRRRAPALVIAAALRNQSFTAGLQTQRPTWRRSLRQVDTFRAGPCRPSSQENFRRRGRANPMYALPAG